MRLLPARLGVRVPLGVPKFGGVAEFGLLHQSWKLAAANTRPWVQIPPPPPQTVVTDMKFIRSSRIKSSLCNKWETKDRVVLGGVSPPPSYMVDVAQLVEHQIVALAVVSSILIIHPICRCSTTVSTRPCQGWDEGSIPFTCSIKTHTAKFLFRKNLTHLVE